MLLDICITFSDDSNRFDDDANGLYALSTDLINGRYYYSFTNDDGETFYIYYFSLMRYWVFNEGLFDKTDFRRQDLSLYCMEYNTFNLVNCSWESSSSGSSQYDWEIHECVNGTYEAITEYAPTRMPVEQPGNNCNNNNNNGGCDQSTTNALISTISADTDDQKDLSADNGIIIGISVALGIIFIIIITIGVLYYVKRKKGVAGFGSGFAEEIDESGGIDMAQLPIGTLQDHPDGTNATGDTAGGTEIQSYNNESESDNENEDDNSDGPRQDDVTH